MPLRVLLGDPHGAFGRVADLVVGTLRSMNHGDGHDSNHSDLPPARAEHRASRMDSGARARRAPARTTRRYACERWPCHPAYFTFDDSNGSPDAQVGRARISPTRASTSMSTTSPDFRDMRHSTETSPSGAEPATGLRRPPATGNGWVQIFRSVAFEVAGDLTLSFEAEYDTESGFDFFYVEYRQPTLAWQTLLTLSGTGSANQDLVVPAANHEGAIEFRFRFTSDSGYSDADALYDSQGAVVVDAVQIQDAGGVVDQQGFEGEPVSGTATTAGDWSAETLRLSATILGSSTEATCFRRGSNRTRRTSGASTRALRRRLDAVWFRPSLPCLRHRTPEATSPPTTSTTRSCHL